MSAERFAKSGTAADAIGARTCGASGARPSDSVRKPDAAEHRFGNRSAHAVGAGSGTAETGAAGRNGTGEVSEVFETARSSESFARNSERGGAELPDAFDPVGRAEKDRALLFGTERKPEEDALALECGFTSLNKYGEELCGDKVETVRRGSETTLVLADGLGSGVKANILATLTSKILSTMVADDLEIGDCVETVLKSLPVCKVRGVAYATFSVIHVDRTGKGYLFEFDNPPAILFRDGKCVELEREKLEILGKTVWKSVLTLRDGDFLLVMSDGVIHAGVGMLLNFGWQREEVKSYLERNLRPGMTAPAAACLVASACNDLYLDKPGDDTTVAAVKIRGRLKVSVMVGPPVDKERDAEYVRRFLAEPGKKAVAGGTSSQIVARVTGKPLRTSFEFPDKDVPPIGFIDGIDLVTEGVITLRKLLEHALRYVSARDLTPKTYEKPDGASKLAKLLFEEATDVAFFVGQSVNKAHQGLPIDTTMKLKLIEQVAELLRKAGKRVTVEYD